MRQFLLLLPLLCSPLLAAPPKLSITASKATKAGSSSLNVSKDERVTIQVAAEAGSVISVVTFPQFTYICPSNKSELTFYASVNATIVIVAVKGTEATQQRMDVVVGGEPGPPPGPGPGPGPAPAPNVPTSAIGKAAYDAAMKVDSPTRAADAALVAKGYRAAATKAAAVATMTPVEILSAGNNSFTVLGDRKKAWASWGPAMFVVAQKENVLANRDTAINALNEIAKGLEAVK